MTVFSWDCDNTISLHVWLNPSCKVVAYVNAKYIVSFKVGVLRCSADVEPSNDMTCSTWFRCHITYVGHDQESYLLVVYTITLSQSNQHYNKNCTPINVDDGP